MPPKKSAQKDKTDKGEVVLLFWLGDLAKPRTEFNEVLDEDDLEEIYPVFEKAIKKVNKSYNLTLINQAEPGLEVFVTVPSKGWTKKKLDNLGKKLENEIEGISLGEYNDRGFRLEYYTESKEEKIIPFTATERKEIENKLKVVKVEGKRLLAITWMGNSAVVTYENMAEKKGKKTTAKRSPVKSTPAKKGRGRPTKNDSYIFAIDRDEYESYYFGPFTLDSKQKETLEKEIIKYNEFSKKLFKGKGPDKSYSSEASRKLLTDRQAMRGKHPPLVFKLVKEDKTDDEWDFYQTGGYVVQLTGKEIKEIITSPYDAYSSVSMGYKILPATKEILKV